MIRRVKHIPEDRQCYNCGNSNTLIYKTERRRNGHWYNFQRGKRWYHLCHKCWQSMIQHRRYYYKRPIYDRIRKQQREYYYRVTKPKLEKKREKEREELLSC
jgi:hypothetical protein